MTWLNTVNTTNLRIVVSIGLFAVYVMSALGLSAFGRQPPTEVLYIVGGAILVSLGIDVKQWIEKRRTFLVTPPTMLAEDAAVAARSSAAPVPVLPEGETAAESIGMAGPADKTDPERDAG